MIKYLIFLFSILYGFRTLAAPSDWQKHYQIDLESPLPTLKELQTKYDVSDGEEKYYDYSWNIGTKFNNIVYKIIQAYGTSEKRLKPDYEENMLEMLAMLPPETYEYIGPFLHTIPGMSEKILNLPGIKETKNKFPSKIAERFQNIEGLEFISPSLYWILMPQELPDINKIVEKPLPTSRPPKAIYDHKFFAGLKKLTPLSNYNPQIDKSQTLSRSDLRTISPTANSLATASDMRAFTKTLPDIKELTSDIELLSEISAAGTLLDAWEQDNGTAVPIPLFKDLAHPCARFLQKLRILGKEDTLLAIAAKQGFTTNEWAYTCDKTIKAYRTSQMSPSTAWGLRAYHRNLHEEAIKQLPPKQAQTQEVIAQGIMEMYKAPLSDTIEAIKIRPELEKSFHDMNGLIAGIAIDVLD